MRMSSKGLNRSIVPASSLGDYIAVSNVSKRLLIIVPLRFGDMVIVRMAKMGIELENWGKSYLTLNFGFSKHCNEYVLLAADSTVNHLSCLALGISKAGNIDLCNVVPTIKAFVSDFISFLEADKFERLGVNVWICENKPRRDVMKFLKTTSFNIDKLENNLKSSSKKEASLSVDNNNKVVCDSLVGSDSVSVLSPVTEVIVGEDSANIEMPFDKERFVKEIATIQAIRTPRASTNYAQGPTHEIVEVSLVILQLSFTPIFNVKFFINYI